MNVSSLLVGLDLSVLDIKLIKYASFLCQRLKVDKIYFLHVAKSLELPEEVIKNYGNVFANVDEGIHHSIQEKCSENFKAKTEVIIQVQEGNSVGQFLRFAKIKNIDLILLGQRRKSRGRGIVDSIARKSYCSFLLLPEDFNSDQIKDIVVPVDFSKHSHMAVEMATNLAGETKVRCINIYKVPTGYYKTGKSFEEFADIMLGHAKRDYKHFIKEHGDIPCDFLLSKDSDYADEVINYMEKHNPDMVILGSKGRTDASIVLLGSMAEKVTHNMHNAPVMVVKEKGESLSVFEAILRL